MSNAFKRGSMVFSFAVEQALTLIAESARPLSPLVESQTAFAGKFLREQHAFYRQAFPPATPPF
jgi:hypothetical protein